MYTFGCSTLIETVAVGFSSAGRYSGPTHFAGAWVEEVEAIAVGKRIRRDATYVVVTTTTGSMVTTQEMYVKAYFNVLT